MSCTVMLKVLNPMLPASSNAVHTTTVKPIGNVLPEDGLQLATTAPLTSSNALGVVNDTLVPSAPVASGVRSGRMSTTGGVKSAGLNAKLTPGVSWPDV